MGDGSFPGDFVAFERSSASVCFHLQVFVAPENSFIVVFPPFTNDT
jgi:hypothetical protein